MIHYPKKHSKNNCDHITYDKCMYGALVRNQIEATQNEGGCTVPWAMFPNGTGSAKICRQQENTNKTYWIHALRVTNQLNDCKSPCHSLIVTLGGKNYEVSILKYLESLYLNSSFIETG